MNDRSPAVLTLAAINATLQSGLPNPLDDAIARHACGICDVAAEKLGEVPYDFVRKRLSVVIRDGKEAKIITKGAFPQIIAACSHLGTGQPLDDSAWSGNCSPSRTYTLRRVKMFEKELSSIVHDLILVLHDEATEIGKVITQVEQVTTHFSEVNNLSAVRARLVDLQYRAQKLMDSQSGKQLKGA